MRDTVVKMVSVSQKKLQPKKKDKWLLDLLEDWCIKCNKTFYRIGKSDPQSNFQNEFALHTFNMIEECNYIRFIT